MTIREAAIKLGVSYQRVAYLRNNGKLDASKNGVTLESVENYHKSERKPGRPSGTFKRR